MNKERRAKLEKIHEKLEVLVEEEQEAYDNLPDNIKYSECGETFESNIQSMETAIEEIESIVEQG